MPRTRYLHSLDGVADGAFLRIGDVAGILRLSYGATYEVVTTGRIAFARFSTRCVRVQARDLRAYMHECERSSKPYGPQW